MALREELHKLVDTVPEDLLAPVEKMLIRFQSRPKLPDVPPELGLLRKGRSMMEGFGGGGHYSPATRAGSSSRTHWDGDTLIVQTRHYHLGHLLDVTQRILLKEKTHLVYTHEISGPNGKTGEHEIQFDLDG